MNTMMNATQSSLGIYQEKSVPRLGEVERRLRWSPEWKPIVPGISPEADQQLFASEFEADIPSGKPRKKERWNLVEEAGRLLPAESVSGCCRHMIHGIANVAIYRSSDSGQTFYGNVKRCGSVWMCAICAARITERRRLDLQDALHNANAKGWRVFLVTFTVPHYKGDEPRVLCDQLLRARDRMQNRKPWREWSKAIGVEGSIRALEVTYGKNGWHVHIHVLLFCRSSETVENSLSAAEILRAWQSACVAVGLPEPNERGVDVRDGTYAAGYVGKWGLEYELTKSHVKRGNKEGRTPWDLLRDSTRGDVEAGQHFTNYAHAFKGRRQLTWSKGLRERLALCSEKTDEQLAEQSTEEAVLMGTVGEWDWQRVLRYKFRAKLLMIAELNGFEGVLKFLSDLASFDQRQRTEKRLEAVSPPGWTQ
jgi:hypothetical protein